MCRTPKHQQDQDALSAQVAAFIAGGGAIQALDSCGRPAGVATEDLPCLPEHSPDPVVLQEVPEESPIHVPDVVSAVASDFPPMPAPALDYAGLVAELRAIRQSAAERLQMLEQAFGRFCA